MCEGHPKRGRQKRAGQKQRPKTYTTDQSEVKYGTMPHIFRTIHLVKLFCETEISGNESDQDLVNHKISHAPLLISLKHEISSVSHIVAIVFRLGLMLSLKHRAFKFPHRNHKLTSYI